MLGPRRAAAMEADPQRLALATIKAVMKKLFVGALPVCLIGLRAVVLVRRGGARGAAGRRHGAA